MENITDLTSLTIAELLAYLAKQESFNPQNGMCAQLNNAVRAKASTQRQSLNAQTEIAKFLSYIARNWNATDSVYLKNAIYFASEHRASYAEIDQLCKEIYLNWDNRFNLVNDFINNHRWGN